MPSRDPRRRLVDLAYRLRAFGIVAALALLVIVTSVAQPRFLSGQEVNIVLGNTSILALLTLGEAMVIISRNVDLSIGSVLGLSAYVSGSMFGHLHGMPTICDRRRLPRRHRCRGCLRNRQRRADDSRSRAEPRGDAGDALHHSRHRHPDHRRRSGRRELAARTRSSRSRSGTSTTSRTSRSRSPS